MSRIAKGNTHHERELRCNGAMHELVCVCGQTWRDRDAARLRRLSEQIFEAHEKDKAVSR